MRYVQTVVPLGLPGHGWMTIDSAPIDATEVEVWNGHEVVVAHNAQDHSGEYQPSFGPGWFRGVWGDGIKLLYYTGVYPQPTHWRPLNK